MSATVPERSIDHRGRAGLLKDQTGAAAIEAALVMPAFFFCMLGIFQFALLLFWQEMLDYATRDAARQMQVGSAQASAYNGDEFVQGNLCPILQTFMKCDNIKVQVNASSNYYNDAAYAVPASGKTINASGFSYCNGGPGQQLLLRSVYMAPFFMGSFLPIGYSFKGSSVLPIVSTAAFVDEFFSSGAGGC